MRRSSLFVDTWGWIKILSPRETGHEAVAEYVQRFWEQGGLTYTTDYVLDETLTLLFNRVPFKKAIAEFEKIEGAIEEEVLSLEWIDSSRFDRAMQLRRRYSDKPAISFTDLTSMVVMNEVELRDVLTGDAHFEHVGMGFRRQPQGRHRQ